MLRIAIVTLGSQGDVQPFVALGLGLKAAGHDVWVATGVDFEPFIRERGLEFVPIGGNLRATLSSREGRRFIRSNNPITAVRRMRKASTELIQTMQEDILKALARADAAVFSYLSGPVIDVAEKTGLPCFLGLLQPLLRTGEFPHPAVSLWNLGHPLNRLTYDFFQLLIWAAFGNIGNRWRRERLGLPPVPRVRRIEKLRIPVLAAFSPRAVPKPLDWPEHAWVTGYWFMEANNDWVPSAELTDFLAAGPRPVCIGFGSMVDNKMDRMTEVVKKSLAHAGLRGILVGGWGSSGKAGRKDHTLYYLDSVPYDWLFPRVSAVVHHGGAGTVAASLRAGVPSVAVPFFADQPFWARRIHLLGVGPRPIPRNRLTLKRLTSTLRVAVGDERLRQRAADLGRAIREEDGVAQAVRIIHRYLGIKHGEVRTPDPLHD
jgi:UDP:flavonoid glycosyltransferase YjiC (YdhE family)